jgi:2-alkyl-3-oxoalkanoate reductase
VKTVAITGASGFTGGAIAAYFVRQGWRVIGFGRRLMAIEGVDYRQWDIASGTIQINESIDVLVHSAAKVDDFGAYTDFHQANVIGTQHVLDSFRDAGQFILISSSSVYDPFAPDKTNISETFPYGIRYLNAYGQTKMLGEKLVHSRQNSVILRPRAIYGLGDTSLLPRLMKARRGKFLLGIGDGENPISLTYVENLCYAVDLVSRQSFERGVFNIADKEILTLRQILTAFAEYMGWDVELLFLPKNFAWAIATISERLSRIPTLTRYGVHQLSSPYTLNIEKAEQVLGYAPTYTYREGFAAVREDLLRKGLIHVK